MPSWAPGRSFAWCRRLATAWCRVSLTRVDLPEPETPVTQQKTPSGIADVDVLEVVFAGAADEQRAARLAALGRHLDPALAGEVLAGQRGRVLGDLGRACRRRSRGRRARRRRGRGRRGGRRRASCPRRARPRSPCCRGRAGGRASRSASRCRAGAGRSRARRARTSRRPGWSRSGSPGGSAAPRRRRASGPSGPARGSRCRRSRGRRAVRRSRARSAARSPARSRSSPAPSIHSAAARAESVAVLGDADPADLDREALRPQPRALAVGAGLLGHVALDPLAVGLRVGLLVAALQVVDDPLEADLVGAAAAEAVGVGDLVALAAGAVEEDLFLGFLQLRPGLVGVDAVLLGDRARSAAASRR